VPDKSKDERLAMLLAYVTEHGKICPQPQRWNELWQLLPNRQRNSNGGWNPPLPLILGAWHIATGIEKTQRLREYIEYAHQNGAFDEVDSFLRRLRESDWYVAGKD